jgi:hypothetical protein
MSDGIVDAALTWCAEETKRGWDVSPSLAGLYRRERAFLLSPLPVPDAAWAYAHRPANLLLAMARSPLPLPVPPIGLCGFALAVEGWTFPHEHPHDGTCIDGCEYYQWVQDGKLIADHPDGLEQRSVIVFTVGDRRVFVTQKRGHQPEVSYDGSPEALSGRIVEALSLLVGRLR